MLSKFVINYINKNRFNLKSKRDIYLHSNLRPDDISIHRVVGRDGADIDNDDDDLSDCRLVEG